MQILASSASSFMLMVDQEKKWNYLIFKSIYEPNMNNWGKCLILPAAILFIGEERLSLLTLLKTVLLRLPHFEKLSKIGENIFQW